MIVCSTANTARGFHRIPHTLPPSPPPSPLLPGPCAPATVAQASGPGQEEKVQKKRRKSEGAGGQGQAVLLFKKATRAGSVVQSAIWQSAVKQAAGGGSTGRASHGLASLTRRKLGSGMPSPTRHPCMAPQGLMGATLCTAPPQALTLGSGSDTPIQGYPPMAVRHPRHARGLCGLWQRAQELLLPLWYCCTIVHHSSITFVPHSCALAGAAVHGMFVRPQQSAGEAAVPAGSV